MKTVKKKQRVMPRIPVEAVLALGSRPLTAKKGAKGYDRKKEKAETCRAVQEENS